MGKLIRINGVTFDPKYILKTIELPDEPVIPDEPIVPVTIADYPVQDGLKGLYDLGRYDGLGNENDPLENHAPNGTNAVLADGNTWTVGDDYAIFSGKTNVSRVITNIQLTLENTVTFVALFRVPTGRRPLIGNRRGTGSTATNFGLDLLNTEVHLCVGGKAQAYAFDTPINSDNFAILALRATTSGVMVDRYTNGVLTRVPFVSTTDGTKMDCYEGVVDAWATNVTANVFKIGGNTLSNTDGDAHISLAAIHEGDITGGVEGVTVEDKLLEICQFVKAYGEEKGLTIE